MAPDRDYLAPAVETLIVGGLVTIGFVTGQESLLNLAATFAAGVGGNWAASLAERGFQFWSGAWFTERGVLNQEIARALSGAFEEAVSHLEDDWQSDPRYLGLKHNNRAEAEITLEPLRWLREDAAKLFRQPERLAETLQREEISALLHRDKASARHFLDEKLSDYFYGHNASLVEFVRERLADEWLICFERRLNDPGDEGTRAWRAFQRLWQASLAEAMAHMQQETADMRDAVLWLREWARRLQNPPPTQRDPTGQNALDAALSPVHTQLGQIKAATDRIEASQERIEAGLAELRQAQAWIRPFQPVGGQPLIFVSSMIGELREERERIEQALRQANPFMPWVFEHTTAVSLPLPKAYLRRVRECDLFVLLIAANISQPVIAEYKTALDARKPILAFIKRGDRSDEAATFVQQMEQARAFKYALFDGPDDLTRMVLGAVLQELTDGYRRYWQAVNAGDIPPPDVDEVIQAYANEIITHDLFVDWQERYAPLRAIVNLPRHYRAHERRDQTERKTDRKEYADLREVLRDYQDRGIVLVGDPGTGKSTSLKRLALDYAAAIHQERRGPVPIYLPLGCYTPGPSLLTYLANQLKIATLKTADGPKPADAHWQMADSLEALTREGRFLFLLDGLNELRQADRARALDEVGGFIKNALSHGCQAVVTCRADDYSKIGWLTELTEVRVQELDDEGIEFFLRAHLGDRAVDLIEKLRDDRRGLLELARNPYRLWMLQEVYSKQGELPANRTVLFKRMVDQLLERQKEVCKRVEPQAWFDADVIHTVLARLAYTMLANPDIFTVAPLNWVDDQLDGRARVRGRWDSYDPRRLLALARASRLTMETEPPSERREEAGTLRFTHHLLQEYFAAVHLHTLDLNNEQVLEYLRHDTWDGTVVLLAGLTQHPDLLVEPLLPLDPFLAARCASLQPDALSPDVARRLIETLARLAWDTESPWQEKAIAALGTLPLPSTVRPLLRATQDQWPAIRCAAIKALETRRAQEAIPTLEERLQDKDGAVRQAAIEALEALEARQSVSKIVEQLSDKWITVRIAAVRALQALRSPEAISYLVERLRVSVPFSDQIILELGDNPAAASLKALWTQDDISAPIDWLQDESPEVSRVAAEALAVRGAREAVPTLIDWLQTEDNDKRMTAAEALGKMGATEAVDALMPLLSNEDRLLRRRVIGALALLGARQVIPVLVECLREEDGLHRMIASEALQQLWTRDDIQNLLNWLRDPDLYVREAAIEGLSKLNAREAIPTLIDWLRDEESFVRESAEMALKALWTRDDIPHLLNRLQDEHYNVFRVAAEALVKFEVQDAVPTLRSRLRDPYRWVREAAIHTVEKLGMWEAIPDLMDRVQDQNEEWSVRRVAAEALGKLRARQAALLLIGWLEEKDENVRRTAACVLGQLGERKAIPHLIKCMQDEDWSVRRIAVWALGELRAREVIPTLVDWLRHEDTDTYDRAAEALHKLWTRDDIPDLIDLLCEETPKVQLPAARALGMLGIKEVILTPETLNTSKTQEAVSRLEDWLRSGERSEDRHEVAARALGALGARQAIPTLKKRLLAAARELGPMAKQGLPTFRRPLTETEAVWQAITQTLEKLWCQSDIPSLIKWLGNADLSDTFQVPAKALKQLKALEAVPALILFIFEGSSQAWHVVANLSPQHVLPRLRHLLAHPEGHVRWSVNTLYEKIRQEVRAPREPWMIQPQAPPLQQAEQGFPARVALHTIVTLADEALALLPGWPLPALYKAEALRRLGCPDAALVALQAADIGVDDTKERTMCSIEQARCRRDCGQRDEALILVRRVQVEAGDDISILIHCADLLAALGAADKAEALYTRIVQLRDCADSRRDRAEFYIRQNRYREAEEDIGLAAEWEPSSLHTYGLRGRLALARGGFAKALEAFEETCRRDPHNVQWQYDLAFAHMGLTGADDERNQISSRDLPSGALSTLHNALAHTELHDQVQAALEDLHLLTQAQEGPSGLEAVRRRILVQKAALDIRAAKECAVNG